MMVAPDNIIELADITRREVLGYVGTSDTDSLYPVLDDLHQRYAVVLVPGNSSERPAWVIIMAEIVGDFVVIVEDITDKPLVDALIRNGGIPRDRIILAYKGDKIPVGNKSS